MVLGVVNPVAIATAQEVQFQTPESSPADADEGHLLIQWSAAGDPPLEFELQQAPTQAFKEARTLYRGPDNGSYVTGLPSGSTFFRVRARPPEQSPGPWSSPLEVVVRFPGKWKVTLLMASGGIMLLLLVWTILRGSSRRPKEEGAA